MSTAAGNGGGGLDLLQQPSMIPLQDWHQQGEGAARLPHTHTPGIKFNGDPQQLGFFLPQVWSYGSEIATEESKVKCVIMALERATVK